MAVQPIPEGYHSVTPYLILEDAARALEIYKKALGAVELLRMPAPGGRIGHAEIKIGDSPIMLADENPEMGAKSARTFGGSPISLMVYVEDVAALAGERRPCQTRRPGRAPGQGAVPPIGPGAVAARMRPAKPRPLRPGMARSRMTTSGGAARAASRAERPS